MRARANRQVAVATMATVLTLGLGVSACGGGQQEGGQAGGGGQKQKPEQGQKQQPKQEKSQQQEKPTKKKQGKQDGQAMAATFGPACSKLPASGEGSLTSMRKAPVASAISSNPQLSTLARGIKQAELTKKFNNAQAVTVFAPTDKAFEQVPKKTLTKAMNHQKLLTKVMSYHVVKGQLSPKQLPGKHKTLQQPTKMMKISGSGNNFTINNGKAKVVCGNIHTANATVYLIDGVLMKKAHPTAR